MNFKDLLLRLNAAFAAPGAAKANLQI